MSIHSFDPVSYRKWVARTFNTDGTPKTPNPEIYVGNQKRNFEATCGKCGFTIDKNHEVSPSWLCMRCRPQKEWKK